MEYVTEERKIERIGIKQKTECKIHVTSKAFEVLARMYSNPIKAIIQELSANAYDSHIRAGRQDVPFKVKLPNKLDPLFKIRDYGISMSPEVIYDVYINYMKSDKLGTNEEVGCFGLGSKTPFAYTDSFNITTFLGGIKRMYTLSYNERGVPELNEFEPAKTDEKDGVEVSFAVKTEDFNTFCWTAQDVFTYFDVKPVVTGNASYTSVTLKKFLSGDGWYFTKDSGSSYAIMGNVAYPIDKYSIDNSDVLYMGAVIQFNIGDLNITPSRESLEYTKHTIKNIQKATERIAKEIEGQIANTIASCTSYWDACVKAKEFTTKFSFVKLDNIKWNNRVLSEAKKVFVERMFHLSRNRVRTDVFKKESNIPFSNKTRIVIADIKKKAIQRAKYLCRENENVSVFFVDLRETLEEKHEIVWDPTVTERDYRHLFGLAEDSEIIVFASNLPDPPKTVRTNASGATVTGRRKKTDPIPCYEFRPLRDGEHKRRRYDAPYWSESEADIFIGDEIIYTEMVNYNVESSIGLGSPSTLAEVLKSLKTFGVNIPVIYGVKPLQKQRFEKNNSCKTLDVWIKEVLNDATLKKAVEDAISSHRKVEENSYVYQNIVLLKDKLTLEKADSPFAKLLETIETLTSTTAPKVSSEFITFYNKFTGNTLKGKGTTFEGLVKKVENVYPMVVSFLENENIGWKGKPEQKQIFKHIEDDINAIDAYRENKVV